MAQQIEATRVRQLRLSNQGISAPLPAARIGSVAQHLLALQAQDFHQAVWALGVRLGGSSRSDVDEALNSGQVVRSCPIRGTLHFLRPEDLRIILWVTAERSLAAIGRRRADLGLDPATLRRAKDAALSALRGGGAADRAEFMEIIQTAGIDTAGQRGPHLIGYLAQTGLLCWGPRRGTQQALVLLDEWAPPAAAPTREEALQHLVLGYFAGHGPATIRDLIWWSKITAADAKAGLAAVRDRLTEYELDGATYWIGTESLHRADQHPRTRGIQLLPGFDEYLLGYQDRSLALTPAHAQLIVPGNNGVFLPVIESGGRIIGTWRRENRGDEVLIKPIPFRPWSEREHQSVAAAAQNYGRFLGVSARVTPA